MKKVSIYLLLFLIGCASSHKAFSPAKKPQLSLEELAKEKEECNERHSKGCLAVISYLSETAAPFDEEELWIEKLCSFKYVFCKRDQVVISKSKQDFSSLELKSTSTYMHIKNGIVTTFEILIYKH